jgi:hypothetical protein
MASWKWQAEKTPVPPKRMLIDPPPPFFYIFIFLLGTRQFLQEFHFLFFGYKVTKNNGGRKKR